MSNTKWDGLIDFIQGLMIFLLIVVVAVCIFTLVAFDGVVGTGSMLYLTNQNLRASVVISLATSGLLMALMFIGYSAVTKYKNSFVRTAGTFILVVAGLIYLLDIYFDSLTADYLRYGRFVVLTDLPYHDKIIQGLFRSLIGGLSTVGESLAVAIILGMPVLKSIIADSLSKKGNHPKQENRPSHRPSRQNRQPSFDISEALRKLPKG